MNAEKELREKVKKYIDEADDSTVKIVCAMLKAKQETDWWDELPEGVQQEIDEAINGLDEGKGISHEKMKELYPHWFKE